MLGGNARPVGRFGAVLRLHGLYLALQTTTLAEHGIPVRTAGGDGLAEGLAELNVIGGHAGHLVDGGRQVVQLYQCSTVAGADGGTGSGLDHQRHVGQRFLKTVLALLGDAVIAGQITVVAEHEDVGVVVFANLAQLVGQQTQLVVEASHHAEVDGAQLRILRFRPILQTLFGADAFQDRAFALQRFHIGAARRDLGTVDQGVPRLLTAVRRMRETQSTIDEKWLFVGLSAPLVEVVQRGVDAVPVKGAIQRVFGEFAEVERILELCVLHHRRNLRLCVAPHSRVEGTALKGTLFD